MLEKPTVDCFDNVRQEVAQEIQMLAYNVGQRNWEGAKLYLKILARNMPAGYRAEMALHALYVAMRDCLDMMDPPVVLDVPDEKVEAPYVQGDGE